MRTHPILFAVAMLSISAAAHSATITYSDTEFQMGGTNIMGSMLLPLFDPSFSPSIPNSASLTQVDISVHDQISGIVTIFNNTGNPLLFTATHFGNVQIDLVTPPFGIPVQTQLKSEAFPVEFLVEGSGTSSGFLMESNFSYEGNPSDFVANGGLPFFLVQKFAVGGFSYQIAQPPGPSTDPMFDPIVIVDWLGTGTTTASVTYTYAVPDGGTTGLLFLLSFGGVLTLRRLAVRDQRAA